MQLQAGLATYVGVANSCGVVIAGGTPGGLIAGLVLLIVFPVVFVGICLWVIAAKVRVPSKSIASCGSGNCEIPGSFPFLW